MSIMSNKPHIIWSSRPASPAGVHRNWKESTQMNTNRRYTMTTRDRSIVRSGSDAIHAKPEAFLSVFYSVRKTKFPLRRRNDAKRARDGGGRGVGVMRCGQRKRSNDASAYRVGGTVILWAGPLPETNQTTHFINRPLHDFFEVST